MALELVLENEWATINYETNHQYMYHTFHKPISGLVFVDTMNNGLDALIEKGAAKWLSDDRKNGQLTQEDIVWSLTDWGPRAADGGWKYWALVVPEDIAARSGMVQIVTEFHKMGVTLRVFTTLEDGVKWIESR